MRRRTFLHTTRSVDDPRLMIEERGAFDSNSSSFQSEYISIMVGNSSDVFFVRSRLIHATTCEWADETVARSYGQQNELKANDS